MSKPPSPNMHHSTRGFTLVETLVAIVMTAIIIGALTLIITYFYRTNGYVFEQVQAVYSARRSVENAMHDLREATYGADGSYPLASVGANEVRFYADISGSTVVEKVHYYLSNQAIYRGVTTPAGNPPSYAGQTETVTLVINNVRNTGSTPLFRYYDASGNELTPPLTTTTEVTSVKITVLTDVNPNRAPLVYTLSAGATLRNLQGI